MNKLAIHTHGKPKIFENTRQKKFVEQGIVDINDSDVNENYFLSEPQDKFHPRQTDFVSVKKNSDEYIQIIEQ